MKQRTIYFIRHAPTEANVSGKLVTDYNSYHILPFDKKDWWENVDKVFPELKNQLKLNRTVLVSKTARANETAIEICSEVFNGLDISPYIWDSPSLNEFDCEGLSGKKFWEITEEEFEQSVKIKPKDMEKSTKHMLSDILNFETMAPFEEKKDSIVCVSHGMKIRYLIWYLSGRKDISAYKVINSMEGVKFSNLDVFKVDFKKGLFGWKLKDMKYVNF